MTDIEQKAVALLNEVNKERHGNRGWYEGCNRTNAVPVEAVCRAIEQHEAFKQKVSDAVVDTEEKYNAAIIRDNFGQFIIPAPKPDPLVEVLKDFGGFMPDADDFRAALEARGLEIREKGQ